MKRILIALSLLLWVVSLSGQRPLYLVSDPEGDEKIMLHGRLGGNYWTTPRYLWINYYSEFVGEALSNSAGIIDSLPQGDIILDGNGNALEFNNTFFKTSVGSARVGEFSMSSNRGQAVMSLTSTNPTAGDPFGFQLSGSAFNVLDFREGSSKRGLQYMVGPGFTYVRDSFDRFNDLSIPPLGLVNDLIAEGGGIYGGDGSLPDELVNVSYASPNSGLMLQDGGGNSIQFYMDARSINTGPSNYSFISALRFIDDESAASNWIGSTEDGLVMQGENGATVRGRFGAALEADLNRLSLGEDAIFRDSRTSPDRRGIQYLGYGEDGSGNIGDYSELLNNSLAPVGLVNELIADSIALNLNYPTLDGLIAVFDSVERRLRYVSGGIFGNDTLLFSAEFQGVGNGGAPIEITKTGAVDGHVFTYDSGSGLGEWQAPASGADGDGIYDGSGNLIVPVTTINGGGSNSLEFLDIDNFTILSANEYFVSTSENVELIISDVLDVSGALEVSLSAQDFFITDSDGSQGILLRGFGEDGFGNGGDYSSFVNNSLVTKGYVDQAIASNSGIWLADTLPLGDVRIETDNVFELANDLQAGQVDTLLKLKVNGTSDDNFSTVFALEAFNNAGDIGDAIYFDVFDSEINIRTALGGKGLRYGNVNRSRWNNLTLVDKFYVDSVLTSGIGNIESIPNNLPTENVIVDANQNQLILTDLSNVTFAYTTSDLTIAELQLSITFPTVEFNVPGFEDASEVVVMTVNPSNDRVEPVPLSSLEGTEIRQTASPGFANDQFIEFASNIPQSKDSLVVWYTDSNVFGSYILAGNQYNITASNTININSVGGFVTQPTDVITVIYKE